MKTNVEIAWHYTVGTRLLRILADNQIQPTTARIEKDERPAVWLTMSERWEETANKGRIDPQGRYRALSREETAAIGGGLVRIGIDARTVPLGWRDYVRESGVKKATARHLEKVARSAGSDVSRWRVRFGAVPRGEWLVIQVWTGVHWETMAAGSQAA